MDDDATAMEEIGQYNQRVRRNRTVKDHHGDALTVSELHGAQAVAGRRQPGGFNVEGEESIARKDLFKDVQRGGQKGVKGRHPQSTFPFQHFKSKILTYSFGGR